MTSKDLPQDWQSFNLCSGWVDGEMVRVRLLAQGIGAVQRGSFVRQLSSARIGRGG